MKIKNLALSLIVISAPSFANPPATGSDNTQVNQRDRMESVVTPDQQKNNHSDLKITQMIRRDIMADKNLSTYAHNVKIIATDGKVVLRGPVRSAEEKSKVAAMAASRVAGSQNVVNELEVTPKT